VRALLMGDAQIMIVTGASAPLCEHAVDGGQWAFLLRGPDQSARICPAHRRHRQSETSTGDALAVLPAEGGRHALTAWTLALWRRAFPGLMITNSAIAEFGRRVRCENS